MRIGSVPYLNALPLTFGADYPIIYETPRKLCEMIASGTLDLALLSTVVLFEESGTFLVPGMAIGCNGPVKSVKLFFNKSGLTIQNLNNFKPSPESNTANMLAQLLLQQVPVTCCNPLQQVTGTCCAEVVIGDAALTRPDPYGSVDLGELWTARTGLPFVFAAWISRHREIPRSLWEELMTAKARNLADLDTCIAASPLLPELSPEAKCHYLQDNIHYEFGDLEMRGLQRFREQCISSGLLPNALPIQLAEIIDQVIARPCKGRGNPVR